MPAGVPGSSSSSDLSDMKRIRLAAAGLLVTCGCCAALMAGCSVGDLAGGMSASAESSAASSASSPALPASSAQDSGSASAATGKAGASSSYDAISASVVPGSQRSCSAGAAGQSSLRDGIYYDSAMGKIGTVNVTVVIQDGNIVRISLGENHEYSAMVESAQNKVIPEIIATQSTGVDVASGATITSEAIIEAVDKILERAAS